ncbi:MAG: hypothetical protein MHM6MM_002096 [Cercozoa sp. M6MM]
MEQSARAAPITELGWYVLPNDKHISLKQIFLDPELFEAFDVFLNRVFCTENLDCCRDILEYMLLCKRSLQSSETRLTPKQKAESIIARYMAADAPQPVNLSAQVINDIRLGTASLSFQTNHDLFSEALAGVAHLMALDSLPKFLRSPEFRNVLEPRKQKRMYKKLLKRRAKLAEESKHSLFDLLDGVSGLGGKEHHEDERKNEADSLERLTNPTSFRVRRQTRRTSSAFSVVSTQSNSSAGSAATTAGSQTDIGAASTPVSPNKKSGRTGRHRRSSTAFDTISLRKRLPFFRNRASNNTSPMVPEVAGARIVDPTARMSSVQGVSSTQSAQASNDAHAEQTLMRLINPRRSRRDDETSSSVASSATVSRSSSANSLLDLSVDVRAKTDDGNDPLIRLSSVKSFTPRLENNNYDALLEETSGLFQGASTPRKKR